MADVVEIGSKRAEKAMKKGDNAACMDMLDMAKDRIAKLGESNVKLLKVMWITDDEECGCKEECDHGFIVLTRDKCTTLERIGAYEMIKDYILSGD